MKEYIPYAAACLACYMIGAVPFGFIIARAKGVDIRTKGSGNIGATNVLRIIGRKWGYTTFVLDVLKGFISAFLIPLAAGSALSIEVSDGLRVICGCFAVVGHNWPVFLKFKGGKGVATSAGALLGVAPLGLGIGLASWIILFFTFRYVSLASILAAVIIGVSSWFLYLQDGLIIPITLSLLAVFATIRHRSNIKNLINGTEHRFEKKEREHHGVRQKDETQ